MMETPMKTYYLSGARIFDDGVLYDDFALQVTGDRVTGFTPAEAVPEGAEVAKLEGGVLTPGFVETQANGGGGVLVNDDFSHQGLAKVIAAHRQFGTVAMLPTFITDTQERYLAAIASIAEGVKKGLPGLVGGHFEGPFLNPVKRGTHRQDLFRIPDEQDFACYEKYSEYLQHSLITLAPEQLPAGIIAQIKPHIPQIHVAHSMADHNDLRRARGEGLTGITHLYNAMRPMQGRDPGPVGSAAALGLVCGIIADGVHSHPYALLNAYRSLGAEQLMLVTDSMHTIGAPEITEFMLTGTKVYVQGNKLINEHGDLAGAHVTLLECVQNALRYMQAPLEDVLRMAVSTPAHYIGRADLASIRNRSVNDVLYLDNVFELQEWT